MKYIKVGSGDFEFKIPQLKACEVPRQVRWIDFNSGNILYGIQVNDKIICSCCGSVFSIDELNELACVKFCTSWVDWAEISEEWIDFFNEMASNW